MSLLRPLLALFVIAIPVWLSGKYVPHHSADNAFQQLYMHLVPEKLVTDAHAAHGEDAADASEDHGTADAEPGHYLFYVSVPGLPAFFDMDAVREGSQLVLTNLALFQIAAMLLIFVCFSGVVHHVRTGQGDWMSRKFAGFVTWVRDDMVYPSMGEEMGRKFLPFFLTLFFFVLFMNLLGLVPGSATATASINVTAALALITLVAMLGCGMVAQGPLAYWKNLVPHVPAALWPLMFIVELVGVLVKPFALMIRLFANMSGGHMIVLSFMGLIFFFAESQGSTIAWGVSPVALGFAVFIMIIEGFVAMLQAYIFTQLSILFVSSSIHPEH